jgi:hypothetical protein
MKNWERGLVPGGFGLAGLLFLFAALKPVFTGLPLNVMYLILGASSLIFCVVTWGKLRGGSGQPKG